NRFQANILVVMLLDISADFMDTALLLLLAQYADILAALLGKSGKKTLELLQGQVQIMPADNRVERDKRPLVSVHAANNVDYAEDALVNIHLHGLRSISLLLKTPEHLLNRTSKLLQTIFLNLLNQAMV